MRREWLENDYYAVLGVDPSATPTEIKKAFRSLAQKHHPDNNPNDAEAEARFKELSEAHAVLSDPSTRAEYDQVRDAFARGAYAGGPAGSTQYVRVEDLGDLGDLFGGIGGLGDLFGGGRTRARRQAARSGSDLETEVTLSFHEAVEGTTKTLRVDDREVTVRFPAAVNDGARIKVTGKGRPGAGGGPPGDLFVRVRAGSHPVFGRKGRDLKINVPITYAEAVLGAAITVPTLDGTVTVRVPPGTKSGTTLRASGRGVSVGGRHGDLLVTVEVQIPGSVDDEERNLLEKLAALRSDQDPRAHLGV